jgi:hypothetical protein
MPRFPPLRGEFSRLCIDRAALQPPARFVTRHRAGLGPSHIEPAPAALAWLTEFLAGLGDPAEPPFTSLKAPPGLPEEDEAICFIF